MSCRGVLTGCRVLAPTHMLGSAEGEAAEVGAVCDPCRVVAEARPTSFGIAEMHADAAAAREPDVMDVALPVGWHRRLVAMWFRQGAAVICEERCAETPEDAEAVVAAGTPVFGHETVQWHQPFVALRARLDKGVIGIARFETERSAPMDVGLHLCANVRFLLGDGAGPRCVTQSPKPRIDGEAAVLAGLRRDSGAAVSVDCSFRSISEPGPVPQTPVRIEGEAGTLERTEGHRIVVRHPGRAATTEAGPVVPARGARRWHAVPGSVQALDGRDDPQPSGRHDPATLHMALAVGRPAETRQAVDLEAGR